MEPLNAKIRNKLTPFWTLTELMADEDKWKKLNSTETGKSIIRTLIDKCNLNKEIILQLIDSIDEN